MKVCVVGCGKIAEAMYLPSLASLAANGLDITVSSLADVDIERANGLAKKYGIKRGYADASEMLNNEKPDAAICLTHAASTAAVGTEILSAGVPLLLEKPPGLNIAETDALISAANKTGAACMVAFNRRHMPVFVKAKEFAGNEVSHVSYDMVRRGRFESDFIITAIHAVDTARWFCGSPFSRVTVNYSEMPEKGESVSNFFLYCTCENGCGADIRIIVNSQATGEKAVLHSRERTVRASVPFGDARTGTGGLFVMEEGNPVIDMGRSEICDAAEDFITNGFYRETEVFFECLTQGKKPADDLESARQSVIVCDALRRRDEWVRF